MRLAPLTALFGSNSSGKTSLLQWLLLLKQTTESPDRAQALHIGDERSLVDLGTFQDLLFQHDASQRLQWNLDWHLGEQPLQVEDPDRNSGYIFKTDHLHYDASLLLKTNGQKELGRVVVEKMGYGFEGHLSRAVGGGKLQPSLIETNNYFGLKTADINKGEYELFATEFAFKRMQGRAWPLPAPVKSYGFPDQVRAFFQNAAFLSDFELAFEKLFSRLFYLGPLREHPKRQYTWAGSRPGDMGPRGERVVDALLAAREQGPYLAYGRGRRRQTLEECVATWLKSLKLVEHFEVRPVAPGSKLFQVWVRRTSKSPEVLITDVGFGVSQILPVIALCYYVPPGSIVVLEQPEIHLHPRVQAGLADVFIEAIRSRKIQIIIESHSEHLLRRLQRRIAEEEFKAGDAALYFCRVGNGESHLDQLRLDTFGNIENWPDDFFGDEFGEIAAMNLAAIKRKREAQ